MTANEKHQIQIDVRTVYLPGQSAPTMTAMFRLYRNDYQLWLSASTTGDAPLDHYRCQ
jgi:hypothetical protein